jgi:hypothetical protein
MSHDSFYFELLFSVDYFGRWAAEVGPVFFCFMIGGEKGGMKDVMDGPGRRELELISDCRHLFCDDKGAMTFRG